jgi:hypothetical protein
MSTLAAILRRLDALEARHAPAPVEDNGPSILARLALIRERLDEARTRGRYVWQPGPSSGSRLSVLIEAARAAQARTAAFHLRGTE